MYKILFSKSEEWLYSCDRLGKVESGNKKNHGILLATYFNQDNLFPSKTRFDIFQKKWGFFSCWPWLLIFLHISRSTGDSGKLDSRVIFKPSQMSTLELFAKIINGKSLTIFARSPILDNWMGPEYALEMDGELEASYVSL